MPRLATLFRLAILAGTACLVRAIVRESRAGPPRLPAPNQPVRGPRNASGRSPKRRSA